VFDALPPEIENYSCEKEARDRKREGEVKLGDGENAWVGAPVEMIVHGVFCFFSV
jgi:hypothetical protein